MGHVVAGQWKPYQYLVESIRKFPCQVNIYEYPKGMVSQLRLAAITAPLRNNIKVVAANNCTGPQAVYYIAH